MTHDDHDTGDGTTFQTLSVADACTYTRRFKLINDEAGHHADGVVFPPPTCACVIVHRDSEHVETHHDFEAFYDQHGDDIVWVDRADSERYDSRLRTNASDRDAEHEYERNADRGAVGDADD